MAINISERDITVAAIAIIGLLAVKGTFGSPYFQDGNPADTIGNQWGYPDAQSAWWANANQNPYYNPLNRRG